MSWEKEEREKGITRREWVRLGMAAGAGGAVLGLGGLSIGQILPPPLKFSGEIRETIQYTKFPPTDPTADLWRNSKAGTAVKVSDFTQRSEEHTSELQSQSNLVCRLLLEKKKNTER